MRLELSVTDYVLMARVLQQTGVCLLLSGSVCMPRADSAHHRSSLSRSTSRLPVRHGAPPLNTVCLRMALRAGPSRLAALLTQASNICSQGYTQAAALQTSCTPAVGIAGGLTPELHSAPAAACCMLAMRCSAAGTYTQLSLSKQADEGLSRSDGMHSLRWPKAAMTRQWWRLAHQESTHDGRAQ